MKIQSAYTAIRNYLKLHKKTPFFMSHGFLHLIVLLICISVLLFFSFKIYKLSDKSYRVIQYDLSFDSGKTYDLNMVNIQIMPKKDNYEFNFIVSHDLSDDILNDAPTLHWKNFMPLSSSRTIASIKSNSVLNDDDIHFKSNKEGFEIKYDKYSKFLGSNFSTNGTMITKNDDANPNINFYFKIKAGNVPNDSAILRKWKIAIDLGQDLYSVLTFNHIYPSPSYIGIGKVVFEGQAAANVLREGGIYIDAEDNIKSYKTDNMFLLYSVLAGTIIAFIIEIIINLIYKWRRLSDK